jgi:hypothetical protein
MFTTVNHRRHHTITTVATIVTPFRGAKIMSGAAKNRK